MHIKPVMSLLHGGTGPQIGDPRFPEGGGRELRGRRQGSRPPQAPPWSQSHSTPRSDPPRCARAGNFHGQLDVALFAPRTLRASSWHRFGTWEGPFGEPWPPLWGVKGPPSDAQEAVGIPQGGCRKYAGACESQIGPRGCLQRALGEPRGAKRVSKVALGGQPGPHITHPVAKNTS